MAIVHSYFDINQRITFKKPSLLTIVNGCSSQRRKLEKESSGAVSVLSDGAFFLCDTAPWPGHGLAMASGYEHKAMVFRWPIEIDRNSMVNTELNIVHGDFPWRTVNVIIRWYIQIYNMLIYYISYYNNMIIIANIIISLWLPAINADICISIYIYGYGIIMIL